MDCKIYLYNNFNFYKDNIIIIINKMKDVSNIDDLFQKLSDLLKQFEFLRSHVIEASEKMKDIAKVYVIKDGGDLIDAI